MKEVADILGCEETHSILQGRIGGAKGILYIEPRKDVSGKKWINNVFSCCTPSTCPFNKKI
jgi:hypothetical protein